MVNPQTLQKYSLFGGLLEEQIEKIIPLMEQEDYPPGTDIMTEGNPSDRIRFIIEGRVAVMKEGVVLNELDEGNNFGEMEVLDVMPAEATIRSMSAVKVFSISNKALREIYKIDVKCFSLIIMNLARELSRRLRIADRRMVQQG
jgi:CRP-like cAMP-binding protein